MRRFLVIPALSFLFAVANMDAGEKTAVEKPPVEKKAPLKIGSIVFEGGDGSTMEKAVIIKNAKGEMEGIEAESKWIAKMHPGWLKGNQSLLNEKDKYYDRIEYKTPAGDIKEIFFDITGFFGK